MSAERDYLYAKLAIQLGAVPPDAVEAALVELSRGSKAAGGSPIDEILRRRGVLTEASHRRIVEAMKTREDAKRSNSLPTELTTRALARTVVDPHATVSAGGLGVAPDPLLGRTIGAIQIEEKIGAGGMGAVYLGRHEGLEKKLVVKVLPRELAADPVLVERFRLEARATARLEHPNVVRVFDVGTTPDGLHYLVMEYIPGKNLERMLAERGGPLDPALAIGIVRGIAAGLEAAHRSGIVHRDIKPSNVLVTKEGDAKVADFGLARDLVKDPRLSQTGQVLGTPLFMSPEQREGKRADPRSDIYSLGAVFYNLLTGTRPLVGPRCPAGVPAALGEIVTKMMADPPAFRHSSMAEVTADLDRYQEGAIRERERPTHVLAKPFFLSGSRRLALVLAGLVSIAIAVWAAIRFGATPESSDEVAPPLAAPPWKDASGVAWRSGVDRGFSLAFDFSRLDPDLQTTRDILGGLVSSGGAWELAPPPDFARDERWLLSGTGLVFLDLYPPLVAGLDASTEIKVSVAGERDHLYSFVLDTNGSLCVEVGTWRVPGGEATGQLETRLHVHEKSTPGFSREMGEFEKRRGPALAVHAFTWTGPLLSVRHRVRGRDSRLEIETSLLGAEGPGASEVFGDSTDLVGTDFASLEARAGYFSTREFPVHRPRVVSLSISGRLR